MLATQDGTHVLGCLLHPAPCQDCVHALTSQHLRQQAARKDCRTAPSVMLFIPESARHTCGSSDSSFTAPSSSCTLPSARRLRWQVLVRWAAGSPCPPWPAQHSEEPVIACSSCRCWHATVRIRTLAGTRKGPPGRTCHRPAPQRAPGPRCTHRRTGCPRTARRRGCGTFARPPAAAARCTCTCGCEESKLRD